MLKPRLKKFYENIICEDFILLYNFENVSCLPNLEKITLNSTSGRFASEPLASMHCFSAWFLGVSQKCVSTRARKSIALFHLRKDNLLGLKVNCRKKANFALLDKLLIWILPRLLSNSLKINKNKQSQSANSLQERAKINQKAGKISRAPFTHRNQNQDKEQNQTKSKLDFGFHKKNRVGRIYLLEMQKKNNKKKTTKFFFTFGHNSARFVPEIAALAVFSDSAFGFSFTCSMAHKLKQHYLSSYRDLPKNLPIQDYFLSMVLHDFEKQNHAKPKREQVDNGETRVENWNQNLFPLRQSQDCARNGIKTQFISAFQFPVSELLFRL